MPSGLTDAYQRFGGTFFLHLHDPRVFIVYLSSREIQEYVTSSPLMGTFFAFVNYPTSDSAGTSYFVQFVDLVCLISVIPVLG
jgi:hypothetical protein